MAGMEFTGVQGAGVECPCFLGTGVAWMTVEEAKAEDEMTAVVGGCRRYFSWISSGRLSGIT